MKTTKHSKRTLLGVLTLIALALPAIAAPPEGKGGGKGGGNNTDEDDPPKPAPITYTQTELRWAEDRELNFGGLYVATVNSKGLVSGWVQRPDGFVHGVVNLGSTGKATNTMVDLNGLLASSLAAVAPGWRIAYARGINEKGLVGCELIPEVELEKDGNTVPIILAVADLATSDLTLVDPGVADPKFLIMGMNRHGDLMVAQGVDYVEDGYNRWGNILYTNSAPAGDPPSYDKALLPEITEYRPAFNSDLQIASVTYGKQYVQRRYDFSDPDPDAPIETWRTGRKDSAYSQGIAEDGTVYVSEGGGAVYRVTISESGEPVATPLTVATSGLRGYRNKVSRAQEPGEEEMLVSSFSSTNVFTIYKPNFGHFLFPGTLIGTLDNINISPPHDPESGQSYIGGYIAFEDRQDVHHSFILTPQGADPPVVLPES